MAKIEKNHLIELSMYLKQMNDLLEKILQAQFGITDKDWLKAMETIEAGFSMAASFIAKVKGKELPPFPTKEEIDLILEE